MIDIKLLQKTNDIKLMKHIIDATLAFKTNYTECNIYFTYTDEQIHTTLSNLYDTVVFVNSTGNELQDCYRLCNDWDNNLYIIIDDSFNLYKITEHTFDKLKGPHKHLNTVFVDYSYNKEFLKTKVLLFMEQNISRYQNQCYGKYVISTLFVNNAITTAYLYPIYYISFLTIRDFKRYAEVHPDKHIIDYINEKTYTNKTCFTVLHIANYKRDLLYCLRNNLDYDISTVYVKANLDIIFKEFPDKKQYIINNLCRRNDIYNVCRQLLNYKLTKKQRTHLLRLMIEKETFDMHDTFHNMNENIKYLINNVSHPLCKEFVNRYHKHFKNVSLQVVYKLLKQGCNIQFNMNYIKNGWVATKSIIPNEMSIIKHYITYDNIESALHYLIAFQDYIKDTTNIENCIINDVNFTQLSEDFYIRHIPDRFTNLKKSIITLYNLQK